MNTPWLIGPDSDWSKMTKTEFIEQWLQLPVGMQLPFYYYNKAAKLASEKYHILRQKKEWDMAYGNAICELAKEWAEWKYNDYMKRLKMQAKQYQKMPLG
jgi:hypothetical protein